jgi:hypothetical protein
MYRHLLVPLDDSPLAVETVARPSSSRARWRAKITFFHAQEDYARRASARSQRVIAPPQFNDASPARRARSCEGRSRRARGRRAHDRSP